MSDLILLSPTLSTRLTILSFINKGSKAHSATHTESYKSRTGEILPLPKYFCVVGYSVLTSVFASSDEEKGIFKCMFKHHYKLTVAVKSAVFLKMDPIGSCTSATNVAGKLNDIFIAHKTKCLD